MTLRKEQPKAGGKGGGDSGNIQVAIRVRPILKHEAGTKSCVDCVGSSTLSIGGGLKKTFTFDAVFPATTPQQRLFEKRVVPLINAVLEGYNATILAYGQTGAGKTHTILGPADCILENSDNSGVIPRAVHKLFELLTYQKKTIPGYEYEVRVQFLELYGEEIRDLQRQTKGKKEKLTIRDSGVSEPEVLGAIDHRVENGVEALEALAQGILRRVTASTAMNQESSRSHCIFSITVDQTIKQTVCDAVLSDDDDDRPVQESTKRSKFHFVDLAGAERLDRTGAVGQRKKEGIDINKGLLVLGNVISALGDPKKRNSHVPYRDSKLTRLLKGSLGGNHKTLMIACVSPSEVNLEESLNCLRYANRAKNIQNKVVANIDPQTKQIMELKDKVKLLAADLLRLMKGQRLVSFSPEALAQLAAGKDADADGGGPDTTIHTSASTVSTVDTTEEPASPTAKAVSPTAEPLENPPSTSPTIPVENTARKPHGDETTEKLTEVGENTVTQQQQLTNGSTAESPEKSTTEKTENETSATSEENPSPSSPIPDIEQSAMSSEASEDGSPTQSPGAPSTETEGALPRDNASELESSPSGDADSHPPLTPADSRDSLTSTGSNDLSVKDVLELEKEKEKEVLKLKRKLEKSHDKIQEMEDREENLLLKLSLYLEEINELREKLHTPSRKKLTSAQIIAANSNQRDSHDGEPPKKIIGKRSLSISAHGPAVYDEQKEAPPQFVHTDSDDDMNGYFDRDDVSVRSTASGRSATSARSAASARSIASHGAQSLLNGLRNRWANRAAANEHDSSDDDDDSIVIDEDEDTIRAGNGQAARSGLLNGLRNRWQNRAAATAAATPPTVPEETEHDDSQHYDYDDDMEQQNAKRFNLLGRMLKSIATIESQLRDETSEMNRNHETMLSKYSNDDDDVSSASSLFSTGTMPEAKTMARNVDECGCAFCTLMCPDGEFKIVVDVSGCRMKHCESIYDL